MTTSQHSWRRRWIAALLLVLLAVAAVSAKPVPGKHKGKGKPHKPHKPGKGKPHGKPGKGKPHKPGKDHDDGLKRLTVIGDSNSDSGNASFARYSFFKQTGQPDRTYYPAGGRFSNGLIWTDYVNQCLNGGVRSYAVAFGTVCKANGYRSNLPSFPNVPVLSIDAQVAALIKLDLKLDLLKQKPHNRATLLWAGINDIIVALFNDPDGPTGPLPSFLETHTDDVINGIIDCLINNILKLIKHGERNFIVVNVQPLELSVLIRDLELKVPGLSVKIGGYINLLNARLALRLANLKLAASVRLDLLDIYTPIKLALTGVTPVPGITDLVNNCLLNINANVALLDLLNLKVGVNLCSNPLALANFDLIHLNSVLHKEVIAKVVINFLKSKGYISGCKP